MRRLYDSGSGERDPALPSRHHRGDTPQSFRSVNSTFLSSVFLPERLRRRFVSITVSTPRDSYPVGTPIPFRVTFRNPVPIPVALPTRSPVEWTWHVDGHREACHVDRHDPPDRTGTFHLSRGSRRVVHKRWNGFFRLTEREWEPAAPGEYTLGVRLNVDGADRDGLSAETTVRIVDE